MMIDVIVVMILYYQIKTKFEGTIDANGNVIVEPTTSDKVYGILLTGAYSVLVVLFNVIYKYVAIILVNLENFQY
jgi:hypothetical protein